MELGSQTNRPLGAVLVEQGVVTGDDVDAALAIQGETNQRLGQILVQRALVSRSSLTKALAAQDGISLEEEGGFGSGLMARIEDRYRRRLNATVSPPAA
jgi:hypothetical protein